MKRAVHIFFVVILIILIFFTLGCVDEETLAYQQRFYYDEIMIGEKPSCYSYKSRSRNRMNVILYMTRIEASYRKLNGKISLCSLETNTDKEFFMDIKLKVESGMLKLCLISPQGDVKIIAEESTYKPSTLNLVSGESDLVIVGIDAYFSYVLDTREYEKGVDVSIPWQRIR